MTHPSPEEARTTLADLTARASRPQPPALAVEDVLAFFDALPPVHVSEMFGSWRGSGLETGHLWDGLLETFGWYGKRYESTESAHPLVFEDARGLFSVNPALMPLGAVQRHPGLVHRPAVGAVGRRSMRAFRTRKPAARLRMVEYRGVVTGTMVYDALPINDHFRQVDQDTLLGAMDMRGVPAPFVFVLRRDQAQAATR